MLRLNPKIDAALYADTYRRHGLVQIPEIFEQETAEAIYQLLARNMSWRILMTEPNDVPIHFDQAQWNGMTNEKRTEILKDVQRRASQNRGFLYYTYPMIEGYLKGWDAGHLIHQVTELINSPDFLGLGRTITGVSEVTKADAHACQYRAGHFLTRHLDIGENKERRAAYVLGFTKDWQPDWGGLLLFLNDGQDIDRGFLPRFNNLTIFDVKYLHTVTQVSSFAAAPRLTITGWFRDDK